MSEREFRRRHERASQLAHEHEHDRSHDSGRSHAGIAPGKRTLTEGLQGPSRARRFELAIEDGHKQIPLLAAGIAARDFNKVIIPTLAAERCLREARENVDAVRDGAERLAALEHALAPLLANAPKISEEASRGRYQTSDRAWDAEVVRWSGAHTVEQIARAGVSGPAQALPHKAAIQRSFGHHDISSARAHVGGPASNAAAALDANAYTLGDDIAFSTAPDLHTAAHEAAHVVQQSRGAARGGLGPADDELERHADRVAGAVVAGISAERLLDGLRGTGGAAAMAIQRDTREQSPTAARVDLDGTVILREREIHGPGVATPFPHKSWKALATFADSVHVVADNGDKLDLEITYRLESRPAELGEVPDTWIHTERRGLLTTATGEHAGATLVGQARVQIPYGEALDPKAWIGRPSIGSDHWGQIYLAESEQTVSVFGAGGRASLAEDASGNDVLAYGDAFRMLVGLRGILHQKHVAGRGTEVAKEVADSHTRARELLVLAKDARVLLQNEIERIRTHHDRNAYPLTQGRWVAAQFAEWLATARRHGRDETDETRHLRAAHLELLQLIDATERAEAPEPDLLEAVAGAPIRAIGRVASGVKELGATVVDAAALGVEVVGQKTGWFDLDYHPLSKYGQWVDDTNVGAQRALSAIVIGVVDEWSDAIERAKHGDFSKILDAGIDAYLAVDGARATAATVIERGAPLAARIAEIAKSARSLVARAPAEAADVLGAMADALDALGAAQRAPAMQMSTAGKGGGGIPAGPAGPTGESLAKGLAAAKEAFAKARRAKAKARAVDALQRRLGGAHAPNAAEWVTRIEAAVGNDTNVVVRFLQKLEARVTDPAPFMQRIETFIGSRAMGAEDVAAVLSEILSPKIVDPVVVLDEIERMANRSDLSSQTRSMLIRRAAKAEIDLDWLKRTKLTAEELEYMGADHITSWKELQAASDLPSRQYPGTLAQRPLENPAGANSKVRGIAGEMVASKIELPGGLKIKRRVPSTNTVPTADFELQAPDGSLAELEAKGYRPENWKELLDTYEEQLREGNVDRKNGIGRLLQQIKAGHDRGRRVYVAISDGISGKSQMRLLAHLKRIGVRASEVLFMPETAIKDVAKVLREHMSIPQPTFPTKEGP